MAIDSDINANADFNSYSPEQLAELQKSTLGETGREFSINSEFVLLAFIMILVIIAFGSFIFILIKRSKN